MIDLNKFEWSEVKFSLNLYKHSITPIFDTERKIENLLADLKFKED
jgi:hypothetical protein